MIHKNSQKSVLRSELIKPCAGRKLTPRSGVVNSQLTLFKTLGHLQQSFLKLLYSTDNRMRIHLVSFRRMNFSLIIRYDTSDTLIDMMFCVCFPVLCYAFAAVEVLCSPGLTKALNTAVGAPPASNTAAGREKG